MLDFIKKYTAEIEAEIIKIRQYIHQNPELSGEEHKTAGFVSEILSKNNINNFIKVLPEGPVVVGEIINSNEFKTIAFRADMDALPLIECSDKSYCSKKRGVMHACGHDFHIAVVLGTAIVLNKLKDSINLNFKFIFQPTEEKSESGAKAVINAGLLSDITSIFTVHAYPSLEAGQVGIKYGTATASADFFEIDVIGKSGHSARPNQAVDSILIMNKIISDLYSEIPRKFDPVKPILFSVCKITGGTAGNIISGNCYACGTLRAFDNNIRYNAHSFINDRAKTIALMNNAKVNIEWKYGPSSVKNNDKLCNLVEKAAIDLLGQGNSIILSDPSLGAEDFSYYTEHIPGVLIRVGTGGKDCNYPLHSCYFDINEKSIAITINLLVYIASLFNKLTNINTFSELVVD